MEVETTTLYRRHRTEEAISSTPDNDIKVDVIISIGILQRGRCESLTRISEYASKIQLLIVFACALYNSGSLKCLYNILDIIGQSKIAKTISRPINRPIRRPKLPHSKPLQKYSYQLLKYMYIIQRNTFFDMAELLKKKYTEISYSFNEFKNDNDLLKVAGKFAIVTWFRILYCRDTQRIREVLNGMLERWPKGVDDTLARIIYNSKMAIAAIIDGDVNSAKEYNRIVKHLSAAWRDPLTKALIFYDSWYTNQRIFEHQRTEEHRKAIIDEMITGLCFLESDSNGCEMFNKQFKRRFLLYVAQYKLNVHNDLDWSESVLVSDDDVRYASNVIECFERTLNKNERTLKQNEEIDPRRVMIYMFCKARVCESQGKLSVAVHLLYKAMELAYEGAIFHNEARNIREFTDRLVLRD